MLLNAEPLARRLLRTLFINLGIDIICAVIVTCVMRISYNFLSNLVFSLCIGLTLMVLIEAGRVVFWRHSETRKAHFMAFIVVVAGIAQFVGVYLAS